MLPGALLGQEEALLIPKTPDGRVVFAIPFQGGTLLGTTDDDYTHLAEEPVLEAGEIDFLLHALQPYVSKPLDRSMVKAGFGGLRPLLAAASGRGTKRLVRDHEIEHDTNSNLFSLLGGKWTTYRLMAKDAIDAVDIQLQAPRGCLTANHRLAGANGYRRDTWQQIQQAYGWDESVCKQLAGTYGSRAAEVAALTLQAPALAEKIHPDYPFIAAQVVYAAGKEMVCKLRDIMARRIRLEICDWSAARDAAPAVCKLAGETLGWSAEKQRQETEYYINMIKSWAAKAGINTGQSVL
jgi:glycerol-3-phosphate dehydrogenase